MSEFTILTDSSANLPEDYIDQHQLEVLSLRFMADGVEYTSYSKGTQTDLSEFYRQMRDGVVYTTSLPQMHASGEVIRSIFERGQDLLYIGFSSGLSGTYEAVVSLIGDIRRDYPDRKVYACDTRAAALGQGLLVMYAVDLRNQGKSISEVHAWLEEHRFHLAHWFTVDDLMYLYRGGRVSRTSATAANVLSIKPVLHVDNPGHLIPREKIRSRKRSIKALFAHMKESFDASLGAAYVGISHGDCEDEALQLANMIREDPDFADVDIIINCLDPVIGAHSGPGTLALFFPATTRG